MRVMNCAHGIRKGNLMSKVEKFCLYIFIVILVNAASGDAPLLLHALAGLFGGLFVAVKGKSND